MADLSGHFSRNQEKLYISSQPRVLSGNYAAMFDVLGNKPLQKAIQTGPLLNGEAFQPIE